LAPVIARFQRMGSRRMPRRDPLMWRQAGGWSLTRDAGVWLVAAATENSAPTGTERLM
jgi:hypothetical protein